MAWQNTSQLFEVSKAKTLADLKKSGLTVTDFKKLKIKVLTAAQNKKLTGHNVAAYEIPYADIHGKPIKNAWRVRHLDEIRGRLGGRLEKPIRYTGPKNELPHLFFPQNFGGWPQVAKDVTETIFITEGEKKAACMCKNGFPTIAVPGVWGWRSAKQGIRIIKDFDCIDWGDGDNPRPVVMVFDNDVITKPQVMHALSALSREMTNFGAQLFVKYLPEGPLKGADDFIVANGDKEFDDLPLEAFEENEAMFSFQRKVAFIKNPGFVYDFETQRNYNTEAKLKFQFAGQFIMRPNADGEMRPKPIAIEWLNWPKKRTYDKIVYDPSTAEQVVNNCVNTWPGWGAQPKKGNVKPFLDLVDFVFANEPDVKEWFFKWLAYPLQNPGTKMFHSVLLWSQATGIGKSLIGIIMGRIYGPNFSEVTKDELTSAFNQWRVNKQFILGDEITGSDSKREADKVKGLITADTFIANEKNQGTYSLVSCENYLLTSNHSNAVYMESWDRRFVIQHIAGQPREQEFYDRIDEWYRHEDGPAHLFEYLLALDLSGFNPHGAAPTTDAKVQMFEDGKASYVQAVEAFLEDPAPLLDKYGIQRDVFTTSEVLKLIEHPASYANPIGRYFTTLGLPRGKVTGKGFAKRLVAIRNVEHWRKRKNNGVAWRENYELDFKDPKYKKGKGK